MTLRIALVEDNTQFRQVLETYLNRAPGFVCVSAYADPRVALCHLAQDKPDVVLMDLQLPGMTGIECVKELRQIAPEIRVIMLTVFEQDEQVFQALQAGAYGYLVKRTPPAKILEAILEVHAGGSPMSAHIARKVVASFHQASAVTLSPQEREVLTHLSHGHTYTHIAAQMGITVHTVRNYIRRSYEKLQVHSRTEAVAKFNRH
ncbi:MAG: response regulator transcription factor [bacterium]